MRSEARFPLKIDWERIKELPEHLTAGSLAALEGPRMAFPLRSEWDLLHPEGEKPFPAPLRGSNESGGVPAYPAAVLKLQRDAEGAGWAVQVTYAIGYLPHATHGRPGEAPKESFAVRMTRGDDRAVAIHMAGSWTFLRRASRMFVPYASLAAFTDDVAGAMVTMPSGVEWAKMLVKYPLRPTKAQRVTMEALDAAYRETRDRTGLRAEGA